MVEPSTSSLCPQTAGLNAILASRATANTHPLHKRLPARPVRGRTSFSLADRLPQCLLIGSFYRSLTFDPTNAQPIHTKTTRPSQILASWRFKKDRAVPDAVMR